MGALRNPASYGQVFTLGSGARIGIKELATETFAAFERNQASHPVLYQPARPGEQRHVEADTTRARTILGWSARTPFAAGLADTDLSARGAGDKARDAARTVWTAAR